MDRFLNQISISPLSVDGLPEPRDGWIPSCITQPVRVGVTARNFFEAHPILEGRYTGLGYDGRHDKTYNQLHAQSV